LADLIKKEFPKLRLEVVNKFESLQRQQREMGIARTTPISKIEYLCSLADVFQIMTRDALNARYFAHEVLLERHSLRLITRVVEVNELFSDQMCESGHTRDFEGNNGIKQHSASHNSHIDGRSGEEIDSQVFFTNLKDSATPAALIEELLSSCQSFSSDMRFLLQYPELEKYCDTTWEKDVAYVTESIFDYIKSVYSTSKGRLLGTVGFQLYSPS
jgi:hypothetical protein